jgi:small nuclear ribonucleoprotein (snRNP)-like protein
MSAASAEASPLLEKVTGVLLKDGRQAIGTLAGFDSDGNILLLRAIVKKPFKSPVDGEQRVLTRFSVTFMVPFEHIAAFHQGDFSYELPTSNTN